MNAGVQSGMPLVHVLHITSQQDNGASTSVCYGKIYTKLHSVQIALWKWSQIFYTFIPQNSSLQYIWMSLCFCWHGTWMIGSGDIVISSFISSYHDVFWPFICITKNQHKKLNLVLVNGSILSVLKGSTPWRSLWVWQHLSSLSMLLRELWTSVVSAQTFGLSIKLKVWKWNINILWCWQIVQGGMQRRTRLVFC